jgi:hypothetical protein
MNTVKSYQKLSEKGPSTFALLVDDIHKMSASEQKLLWMQLNQKKLSSLAKALDASVVPHNLSQEEIDALITEAKQHGRKKKG